MSLKHKVHITAMCWLCAAQLSNGNINFYWFKDAKELTLCSSCILHHHLLRNANCLACVSKTAEEKKEEASWIECVHVNPSEVSHGALCLWIAAARQCHLHDVIWSSSTKIWKYAVSSKFLMNIVVNSSSIPLWLPFCVHVHNQLKLVSLRIQLVSHHIHEQYWQLT
jgi:hypothetical protein